MSRQCPNAWLCSEVEPLEKKSLTRPKVHFARTADIFESFISRFCGQRKRRATKRPVSEDRILQKMFLRLRPDNGSKVYPVALKNVEPDDKIRVILVSHRLAQQLLEKPLWRIITPRSYTDDHGIPHKCDYSIKVSWRWDNEGSTEDAKIYVVSKEDLNAPLRSGKDVLMPTNLYGGETGSKAMAQPIHVMPPQTQAQKDAAKKKEKELEKERSATKEAAGIKKEREYEEQLKGPR